ncbi:MAG: hypothetical protein AB7S48_09390 [Bacteroidales bacterium]
MKAKLLSLILLVGLIGFNSCQKDDDPSPLTQEEAVVAIEDSQDQYETATTEISNNSGYKIQDQLSDMYLPFSSYYKSSKSKSSLLSPKIDTDKLKLVASKLFKQSKSDDLNFDFNFIYDIEDIDFSDYAGTWNWSNSEFVKTSNTPTDKIILNFPYPMENSTNNATLTYYDCTVNSTYGFITGIKGKIEVSGSEVLSFELSSKFSSSEISSTVSVKFGSYSLANVFSLQESSLSASVTVKKDGAILYKQSAKITFKETSSDILFIIEAKMIIASLEFRVDMEVNYSDIGQLESMSPNDYMSISLYTTGGAKVGDFKFVYDNESQNWELYFVYTTGVEVSSDELMSLFGDRLYGFYGEIVYDLLGELLDYK